MYRRLAILSGVILFSLTGLGWLGYHAIELQADGLQGRRWAEFASVAEQIRRDVNRKLDDFRRTEQNRPYTHYQYSYVPEEIAQTSPQPAVLRSPLGDQLSHGLAYGYFQIESDGRIIAPFFEPATEPNRTSETGRYVKNIRETLLPVLNSQTGDPWRGERETLKDETKKPLKDKTKEPWEEEPIAQAEEGANGYAQQAEEGANGYAKSDRDLSTERAAMGLFGKNHRAGEYKIESLQSQSQKAQVVSQSRAAVEQNILNIAPQRGLEDQNLNYRDNGREKQPGLSIRAAQQTPASGETQQRPPDSTYEPYAQAIQKGTDSVERLPGAAATEVTQDDISAEVLAAAPAGPLVPTDAINQGEKVQVRLEPFVPVAAGAYDETPLFGEQIFLVRHVQIEDRHFLQGFRLNDKVLVEEVAESARRLMREGMSFSLDKVEAIPAASYRAILDFGFGELVLNLLETDPGRLGRQIRQLRVWYFGIVAVVLVVVGLGVASVWRNVRGQLKLAQQKDDFISAVSHELRTPLTSIRMYTEMLEKGYLKTEDKRTEYLQSMRQESERLSRLIENVLDFSRIQRGRKKYDFQVGDINECVRSVVEMMRPYAGQHGFVLEQELQGPGGTAFDRDAVMQIVINLVDNAVKYARETEDKRIIVRTGREGKYVLLEVEDHGPGVPYRQRDKVFDEFYRGQEESRRETTGTGLGLALVKKFAEAHGGFVEILTAQPTGAIFRVGLAVRGEG